jgi:iron complex outermembrane recepter protein
MSRYGFFAGRARSVFAIGALVLATPVASWAESAELEALSLEELMQIQVTSVSKRPQRVIDTPAAISVLTREEIRRSGHTSLPELLRMVPGAGVGHFTPKSWAVGIRGDESQFSRMLLVLVDGRAAYSTAFNGTFWDTLDMPLEDIERIEVIRGPGASVWGANAVHGVINIIRRKPEDAETYASATVGNEDRLLTSLGYTGALGERFRFRMSSRYVNRDSFAARTSNTEQHDDYRNGVGAFRGDLDFGENATLTLQGDWYGGDRSGAYGRSLDTTGTNNLQSFETYAVRGGNVLSRLELRHSESAATELQMYYDKRSQDLLVVADERTHYDLEFRNRFRFGTRNQFNWGAGARHISENPQGTLNFVVTPERQDEAIYNLYLQNEYAAIPNELSFTAGSKIEWNTYTGWEVQPTARFLWAPVEHHQFWGAVSRAVRIPSRLDRGEYLVAPTYVAGAPFGFQGTDNHDSEIVIEYDLGYRLQPSAQISVDVTGFAQRTQNFQVYVPRPSNPLLLELRDSAERRSVGAEATVRWHPVSYWNLVANWTHIHIDHSRRVFSLAGRNSAPAHQLGFFSYLDLPGNFELDLFYYFHGRFRNNDNTSIGREVHDYSRYDARLAWRPTPRLELSVVGQNLGDRRHREGPDFFEGATPLTGQPPSAVERSCYAQIRFSF